MTVNPHHWAMSRFAARRAGLLNDDEERRIAEHLASCETCGPAWQAEQASEADAPSPRRTDPHIPAGVLATWPRASQNLRGFERAMVREHLERCETCRQDLELLGYAPSLEVVPALEWAKAKEQAPAKTDTVEVEAHTPNVIRVFRLAPRRADWTRWAFGGWAAIASAAALLLFVNPGLIDRGGDQGPPGVSPTGPPSSTPPGLAVTGSAMKLGSALRGGPVSVPERAIPPETRFLPLALEPLDLPTASPVEVSIQREGDTSIIRATVANGDLDSGQLLLSAGDRALEAGTYVVRLRGGPAPDAVLPEPLEAEYRFVLRIAAADKKP